jgi:CheY-like chemotaxis protein
MDSQTRPRARILVIDDDPHFLELLVAILSYDHSVTSATTGAEALRWIRSRWFDLVCTDYDLPDMNGVDLLHQLAELTPGTSGLLITGADARLAPRPGPGYHVLLKPFEPERLLALAERLVGAARPPAPDPLALVEQAAFAEEALSRPRHAARTKLATVRNAAFVIRQKLLAMQVLPQEPGIERFLRHIESEVDELTKILAEGNAATRIHHPHPEPIALDQVVRRGVDLRRARREDQVVLEDIPEAMVLGDAEELALAVRCLVETAVDASPDGGKVVVRCVESSAAVHIEVADEGGRSGAADATRAPHPSEAQGQGHAGLSLSIARRIALKSGGGLTLDASPAGGSLARLELARSQPAARSE